MKCLKDTTPCPWWDSNPQVCTLPTKLMVPPADQRLYVLSLASIDVNMKGKCQINNYNL